MDHFLGFGCHSFCRIVIDLEWKRNHWWTLEVLLSVVISGTKCTGRANRRYPRHTMAQEWTSLIADVDEKPSTPKRFEKSFYASTNWCLWVLEIRIITHCYCHTSVWTNIQDALFFCRLTSQVLVSFEYLSFTGPVLESGNQFCLKSITKTAASNKKVQETEGNTWTSLVTWRLRSGLGLRKGDLCHHWHKSLSTCPTIAHSGAWALFVPDVFFHFLVLKAKLESGPQGSKPPSPSPESVLQCKVKEVFGYKCFCQSKESDGIDTNRLVASECSHESPCESHEICCRYRFCEEMNIFGWICWSPCTEVLSRGLEERDCCSLRCRSRSVLCTTNAFPASLQCAFGPQHQRKMSGNFGVAHAHKNAQFHFLTTIFWNVTAHVSKSSSDPEFVFILNLFIGANLDIPGTTQSCQLCWTAACWKQPSSASVCNNLTLSASKLTFPLPDDFVPPGKSRVHWRWVAGEKNPNLTHCAINRRTPLRPVSTPSIRTLMTQLAPLCGEYTGLDILQDQMCFLRNTVFPSEHGLSFCVLTKWIVLRK